MCVIRTAIRNRRLEVCAIKCLAASSAKCNCLTLLIRSASNGGRWVGHLAFSRRVTLSPSDPPAFATCRTSSLLKSIEIPLNQPKLVEYSRSQILWECLISTAYEPGKASPEREGMLHDCQSPMLYRPVTYLAKSDRKPLQCSPLDSDHRQRGKTVAKLVRVNSIDFVVTSTGS